MDFHQGQTDILDGKWICPSMRKQAFENVPYMVNLKEKTLMTITSMKKYITKSYNDFC